MENTPKAGRKAVSSKAVSAITDNNISYYQFFYLSLVSLLLLVDILFQHHITNLLIKRSWGINNFSYFPWWIQAFVFVALFTFAIPSVNDTFRLFVQKHATGTNKERTRKLKKIFLFAGISLLIALLFYLFKVKFDLLGDMNLRVSQSVQGKYIDDEYFTMYIMHYLAIFLQKLLHLKPHQTFVLASIAAGFSYSLLGLLMADLLFTNALSFIFFFLFYLFIGTILVFCGYVEIYAIPAASASLYIYTALLCLKKKVSIIIPFLCMVLAVALHKEQVSVLPSFIFLATRKIKFMSKIDVKIILLLFIISIPLIYLLNAGLHLQSLMSLAKDKQHPTVLTLFSFAYWWELFNSQYISSGILLFLFILILYKAVKGQIKLDDYSKFFLIATLFIYSIVIVMNKERGSGDWDVCSFPAIYLSMFVAYTSLTQWKAIYSPKKVFYILSTALLFNVFNCSAWVGLNSEKKSMNKIQDMLLTDPGWYYQVKLPPEMELSILFNMYDSQDTAMKYYKVSYEKYGNSDPDAVTNYIAMLMYHKDTTTVVPILEKTTALHPLYSKAYGVLFQIYQKKGEYDKIYKMAKIYVGLYNTNSKVIDADSQDKAFMTQCVTYLYNASLARHDTLTTRDVLSMMQKMHIPLNKHS